MSGAGAGASGPMRSTVSWVCVNDKPVGGGEPTVGGNG